MRGCLWSVVGCLVELYSGYGSLSSKSSGCRFVSFCVVRAIARSCFNRGKCAVSFVFWCRVFLEVFEVNFKDVFVFTSVRFFFVFCVFVARIRRVVDSSSVIRWVVVVSSLCCWCSILGGYLVWCCVVLFWVALSSSRFVFRSVFVVFDVVLVFLIVFFVCVIRVLVVVSVFISAL